MDPISALILMAAQFGVKRALGSIVGDDIGGLAAAFLGVVVKAEHTQERLITIEQKLDTLRDQNFEIEIRDATRLVERALSRGADQPERGVELARGQRLLERAVASTNNPLARALAERMAIIVQLLRGDAVAASQSCRLLSVAAGDAISDAYALRRWPGTEVARRIEAGEYGSSSWLERWRASQGTLDRRYDLARTDILRDVDDSLSCLVDLLNFATQVSTLVDDSTGPNKPRNAALSNAWLASDMNRVHADVLLETETRLGGVSVILHRPDGIPKLLSEPLPKFYTDGIDAKIFPPEMEAKILAGHPVHSHTVTCTVAIDANRQREVECRIAEDYAQESVGRSALTVLRPGDSATITGAASSYGNKGLHRFGIEMNGIVMSAEIGPKYTGRATSVKVPFGSATSCDPNAGALSVGFLRWREEFHVD